jgi:hypothetical protein
MAGGRNRKGTPMKAELIERALFFAIAFAAGYILSLWISMPLSAAMGGFVGWRQWSLHRHPRRSLA